MPNHAKLVWITPNAEAVIAKCARISNPNNEDNPDYEKLLRYCIRNNHVSIFEMASLCLEIKCTRAISRQFLRHRSFSFQEFSQRYSTVSEEPTFVESRMQDPVNRQNSIETRDGLVAHWFRQSQDEVWRSAKNAYETALKAGVAKECARALLPEGMTPSRFYMSGTVRSFIHLLDVRLFGPGVQKEAKLVAHDIFKIFQEHFPTITSAKNWEA